MSGATRLHAFYNGGSRGGAKGAKDEAVGGSKLREEACVNDFGRFVHTGNVQCKGRVHKGTLNSPATMTSLPVIVDNDRFSFHTIPPIALLLLSLLLLQQLVFLLLLFFVFLSISIFLSCIPIHRILSLGISHISVNIKIPAYA